MTRLVNSSISRALPTRRCRRYPVDIGFANAQVLDSSGVTEVVICGAMSHMCVDAVTRAANDFGYKVTVVHDACASRDLEFDGVRVPAAQVHAAFMAALGFGYATTRSTREHLGAATTA